MGHLPDTHVNCCADSRRRPAQIRIETTLLLLLACLCPVTGASGADDPPAGILVRLDHDRGIVVEFSQDPESTLGDQKGLWILPGIPHAIGVPLPSSSGGQTRIALPALIGETRGDLASDGQAVAISVAQLDQLASGEVVRDTAEASFLTPVDQGAVLRPTITIRRRPRSQKPEYPEETCTLRYGRSEFEFIFPEGRSRLRWSEITELPENLKAGLPAGRALLRMKDSGAEVSFVVAPPRYTAELFERTADLRNRLQESFPNLADQILVESLLQAKDLSGDPISFLADALDVLDRDGLSAHLQQVHDELLARLSGEEAPPEDKADDAAELAQINWARDLLARGEWDRAIEILQSPEATSTPRAERLARMYLGVALAESNATLGEAAHAEFLAALQSPDELPDADAYRIHNNYGNFLLREVQNGLFNRSLRAASGASSSLYDLFALWREAADQYEETVAIGSRLDKSSEAAARVNLARHYALLADLLFTVNATLPESDRMPELEAAASDKSHSLAERVIQPSSEADFATRAAAAEALAQLSHRRGNEPECRQFAELALRNYIDMGSVLGAEGIFRMLGLSFLAQAQETSPDQSKLRSLALDNLMISHLLSELLREQYPDDVIGLSRAGFLSRRAYVTDRIVELLLQQEDYTTALELLETSKARALQDMLSLQQGQTRSFDRVSETTASTLADWPQQTIGLEYFLGTEHPWVFCVTGPNAVMAYRLQDETGNPLSTPEFIARVRVFLNGMEGAAGKMLRSYVPGQPFDGSWQHDLHRFWKELIPSELREQLMQSQTVVIIPQHLLHYFPFAALVTQVDLSKRGPMESVMPQFWIESGVNLIYAPSFASWKTLRSHGEQTARVVRAIGIASFANASPLPGVKSDLANLQQAFADALIDTATGSGVTETTVRSLIQQPGLVFIGTHGANLPDTPLASYLLCHSDSENDGHFMAGEIYGSRFQSCIAILSACYSGLADRSPVAGDELFGIERALLHAGVRTVVDGVWDVYDATGTEIMNHVFAGLRSGKTTCESVAGAQREFLQTRRKEGPGDPWIHPYFWSVYKVSGSDLTRFATDAN